MSLLEVIERLRFRGPAGEGLIPIQLELVTLWGRTELDRPARSRGRLRVVGPDGSQLTDPVIYDIDLTKFVRLRSQNRMNAFPVRAGGKYMFHVELENEGQWEQVARVPLDVVREIVETES